MKISTTWTSQLSHLENATHLVLHLHWRPPVDDDEAHFVLWAETSDAPQPSKLRGRIPARPKPKPHPYAVADVGDLRGLMQNFNAQLITQGSETVILYLPSTRTGPLPSPELVHPWALDRNSPFLAPWSVTGVRLPLSTGIELFSKIPSCQCPEHTVLGSDMQYWQKAFSLVLEFLTQQQYIPSIALQDDASTYEGVWQPVLEAPTVREKVLAVADALPPLCRSELTPDDRENSALFLLEQFICATGDNLVRDWGVHAPHRIGYLHNQNSTIAWLKSLLIPSPIIEAPNGQVRTIASEIQTWQQDLAPAGNTSYAIALRLVPPPTAEDTDELHVPESGWYLEYELQVRDNPELVIPAEQVWQTQDSVLIYRQHRFKRPQEKLLKSLGQAAKIFKPIERSLQQVTPTGVDLTTTEVYEFLSNATPLLEASGFSLLLPDWWEEAGARLGLQLYLVPERPEPPDIVQDPDSQEHSIYYRWDLVLGDTTLSREAFENLVALRSPLVQKGDRWLRLDPDQIKAARRFWKRHTFEGHLDLRMAMRLALGLDPYIDIAGLPIAKVIPQGWLPDTIARLSELDSTLCLASQPHGLTGTLRPYQCSGYAWLHLHRHLGLGACRADDMGLGKSIQAIALLLREKEEVGELPAPTLLVCPTSLLGNWRREFERFAPQLRVFIHYGTDRPRNQSFKDVVSQYDVILTSYTLARRDATFFQGHEWYGLILDEAQKIKNPETQVAQAIYVIPAQFRMALTGTPVENKLTELWSLFHFLNKGYLGSQSNFRKHIALPIERYQDPIATRRLKRMVRPFILRRLKSDPAVIQDLPERQEMKIYRTLSEEQAALYQSVVEEGLPRIADARGRARRIHVFNLLTRLKQILNHPVQYSHKIEGGKLPAEVLVRRSGKLDRLDAMLEEVLAVGDKALVFTQFAEMGHLLSAHIKEYFDTPVFYMYGGVPANKRQDMVTRFQDDPRSAQIFVMTLRTGGLGLNLTAANHVFHYDRWWNPAVENQASDRIYRIGQTRNVQIHKLITAGTVEEAIDEMIERKQGLAEAIIGSDESWISSLSDSDLASMVNLQTDRL